MKKVLFAGSFDPPTWGHLDVIQRAALLCDKLIVGVAVNTGKEGGLLPPADRIELLQEISKEIPHVTVIPIPGLIADFVKEEKVDLLLRALRNEADFEREEAMALANRQLADIETLFLLSDPRFAHISSTLVREIAHFGGALDPFVPPAVARQIFLKKTSG